ncbi:MAG: hypothetical protein ACK46Q_14915 [Hyphomonas sp.]
MPNPPKWAKLKPGVSLTLDKSSGQRHRTQIEGLAEALQQPSTKREAPTILWGMISEIRMTPDLKAPDGHRIELVGELAGILGLASSDQVLGSASSGRRGARIRKPRC